MNVGRVAGLLSLYVALMLTTPSSAKSWDEVWSLYQAGRFDEAFTLIVPLAEAGDVDAQDRLTHMYYYGEGTPIDYPKAHYWAEKSAAQGSLTGMTNICAHYTTGDGVPQDLAEAIKWCTRASDLGDRWSTRILAYMAILGEGVPKDEEKGLVLLREAAEGGDAKAQEALGLAYIRGDLNLPFDPSEAANWLRRAADGNLASAQRALVALYIGGYGVEQSRVLAVMWDDLAVGHYCLPVFEEVNPTDDPLTRSEIAAALALAKAWRKQHPGRDDHPHPNPGVTGCAEPYHVDQGAPSREPPI